MSDITVNNQTNNNVKTIAIAGGAGAAAGAAINGCGCYLSQKSALANPKAFLDNAQKTIDEFKKSDVPKETVSALEDALEKSKEFIKKGKIDFKTITKKAAGGAAVFAAIGAVVGLIISKNKKPNENNQNKSIDAMA